jgi:hypothetical protein
VTCRIDGLINGQTYSLTMAAITEFGVGRASPSSSALTPIQNFSAVSQLTAISGAETTTLTWGEPLAVEGSFERYEVYVTLPGEAFPDQPVSTVSDYESIGAVVQLASLPNPYTDQDPAEGQSYSASGLQAQNLYLDSQDAILEDPILEPPTDSPGNNDPMSQVPRYEFKVVTITSALKSSETLNTAFISQQLVSVPSAPNSVSAEFQGEEILIGWTASKFDGGSRILSYQVRINGTCIPEASVTGATTACREFAPNESTFSFTDWKFSTSYEVLVVAKNEMGLSRPSAATIATLADPTPPANKPKPKPKPKPSGTPGDLDGDGIPDDVDSDIDGDGRPNGVDPDIDEDGIPNEIDPNPVVPNSPDDEDGKEPPVPVDESIDTVGSLILVGLALIFLLLSATLLFGFLRRRRSLDTKQHQA